MNTTWLRPLVAAAVLVAAPGAALAQDPGRISADCLAGGADEGRCAALGLAARALVVDLSAATGFGSDVAGTASNLGQRLGASPRVSFSLRASAHRTSRPDLLGADPSGEAAHWLTSTHVGATAGLFDGFRLLPTVGGFLALDVFGTAGIVRLPEAEGLGDGSPGFALGARIGILRESFTLPGVSVSVAQRFVGGAVLGGPSEPADVRVDPSTLSLRATVGKDIYGFELLGGFGVDEYGSDVTWTVTDGAGGSVTGDGRLEGSRRLWFVGASTTFGIVLSISLEMGLARGLDTFDGFTGDHDPTAGAFFAGTGLRLTI